MNIHLDANNSPTSFPPSDSMDMVNQTLLLLTQSNDSNLKLQAARDIRRLTKTSHRYRRHFSDAVIPLVDMLRSDSVETNEAALLALLNLAVKDDTNKTCIVDAGALEPIIRFLQSENNTLQAHAAASLLTLSVSTVNKPIIGASGAILPLVDIVGHGSSQSKAEAATALYNLSTHPGNLERILQAGPIPPLVDLLKSCKKSSKTALKCISLLESLVTFDEAKSALTSEEGGVLAVVVVLERGSLQSREHAVGVLLTMCQRDRCKYREPILREGVIPGLLQLTVQGTPKAQSKAHTLLRLLRDTPYPRSELQAAALEEIVCTLISNIDGEDQSLKAKQMLAEMVQVSMEQSLRHLQKRALVCTQTELPITSCASEVALK